MTAAQRAEVERLLRVALQLSSAERQDFIDSIPDAEVRARIDSLLVAAAGASRTGIAIEASATAQPLEGPSSGSLLGHFRVLRELGHGGMGVVYLAEDSKLDPSFVDEVSWAKT